MIAWPGTGVSLCSGANILELDTVMMVAQHRQCILGATGWSAAFSIQRFCEVERESFNREGPVGRVRRILPVSFLCRSSPVGVGEVGWGARETMTSLGLRVTEHAS